LGDGSSCTKPKRTLSAAARRNIAAAQEARWAKVKAGSKPGAAKKTGCGSYKAHHVGIRPEEDRDGTAEEVGEGVGG
jgi:hypothetical protein